MLAPRICISKCLQANHPPPPGSVLCIQLVCGASELSERMIAFNLVLAFVFARNDIRSRGVDVGIRIYMIGIQLPAASHLWIFLGPV